MSDEWEEHVREVEADGGRRVTPNGLPVRCIRYDGLLLECEDGDHPTYICPVEVETGDPDPMFATELHAAIYCDGNIVLTMYECCYGVYRLSNGKNLGLSKWMRNTKLSEASRKMLKERFPGEPLPDVVMKSAPDSPSEEPK